MIKISPKIQFIRNCPTCKNTNLNLEELVWQGVHICAKARCIHCSNKFLIDLPTAQGKITPYCLNTTSGRLYDENNHLVNNIDWFNSILFSIQKELESKSDKISIDVDRQIYHHSKEKVIILNTLNFIYGHSLLQFFNVTNIIKKLPNETGLIVIIQPFLKWLLPKTGLQEVWIVNMGLNMGKYFYPSLNEKLNFLLTQFEEVYLSSGHILPYPVDIESLTAIKPFQSMATQQSRITFIWREDPGRLWIKNWLMQKIFVKLSIGQILKPIHYVRVLLFFYLLRRKFKIHKLTLAGLGKTGKFPSFVDDQRVETFSKKEEILSCKVYSESELVIGIHGSSMLLPSAHAGMTVSLMPPKRWGNYGEDILPHNKGTRSNIYENRILPISMSIFDLVDACFDMVIGHPYFQKKFIYDNQDL